MIVVVIYCFWLRHFCVAGISCLKLYKVVHDRFVKTPAFLATGGIFSFRNFGFPNRLSRCTIFHSQLFVSISVSFHILQDLGASWGSCSQMSCHLDLLCNCLCLRGILWVESHSSFSSGFLNHLLLARALSGFRRLGCLYLWIETLGFSNRASSSKIHHVLLFLEVLI